MWLFTISNEKLTAISVWSTVCHRQNTSTIVLQVWNYFIFELLTPYAATTFSSSCRITSLHHETFDTAMKEGGVVVPACTECQEILTGLGTIFAEQFNFHV